MPYNKLDSISQLLVFSGPHWIPVEDLAAWITETMEIDFSVRALRTEALDKFNSIKRTLPASKDHRCAMGAWVCMRDSDWPSKESRLRALLTTRPTGKGQSPNSSKDADGEILSSDSVLSFYRLLQTMLTEVEKSAGVYDRARIDERFGWTD